MSTHTHHTMTYISKYPRVRFGFGLEFGFFFGRGGAGTTSGWGGVRYDVYIYIIYIYCVCMCVSVSRSQPWMQGERLYLSLELLRVVRWSNYACETIPAQGAKSHRNEKKDRHHKQQNHAGPTWHVEEDNSPQGNCYVRFRQTCDPSVFGCFTVCIGGLWYSRKKPRVMKRMAITDLNSIVWIVQDSRWQWTSAKFWHDSNQNVIRLTRKKRKQQDHSTSLAFVWGCLRPLTGLSWRDCASWELHQRSLRRWLLRPHHLELHHIPYSFIF